MFAKCDKPARPKAWAAPAVVAALAVVFATPATGHERPASYSTWRAIARPTDAVGERFAVTLRLAEREATRLPWYRSGDATADGRMGGYATDRLQLSSGDGTCLPDRPVERAQAPAGSLVYRWSVTCPPPAAATLRSELFHEVAPAHLHFARLERSETLPVEAVLTSAAPEVALEPAGAVASERAAAGIVESVELGIRHILSGYDHLLFVLALILIERSFATVARVVTGFTVAHSLTLALAALGWLRPDTIAVEPLIALSIAVLAAENLWLTGGASPGPRRFVVAALVATALGAAAGFGTVPAAALAGIAVFAWCYLGLVARARDPRGLRWAAAFVFGLLHGFGFAGFLLKASFSQATVATRLFGFNVGVEVGQLVAVALVWPLLAAGTRRLGPRRFDRLIVEPCSVAVLAAGVYWFTVRSYF